jgi:hypothetical protein
LAYVDYTLYYSILLLFDIQPIECGRKEDAATGDPTKPINCFLQKSDREVRDCSGCALGT